MNQIEGSAFSVPTLVPERRNEAWHQDDAGDWLIAAFDIEIPDRVLLKLETQQPLSVFEREEMTNRVDKGFQQCIKEWLPMRAREGFRPVTKPFLRPGFFLIPDDPEALGKRRMYVTARWVRDVPELLNIDDAAGFSSLGAVDQAAMLDTFFEQMTGISRAPVAQMERHMKANLKAPEKAKRDAAEIAASDWRETHRITGVRRRAGRV